MRIYCEETADGRWLHNGLGIEKQILDESLPGAIKSGRRLEALAYIDKISDELVREFGDKLMKIIQDMGGCKEQLAEKELARLQFMSFIPHVLSGIMNGMIDQEPLLALTIIVVEDRLPL